MPPGSLQIFLPAQCIAAGTQFPHIVRLHRRYAELPVVCCHTQTHTRPLWLHAAVGQFKELVESSETDQPLQETLKKVLNFTSNGWHKAREHAMRAVSTDNRMRAWCADDSLEDGLLFKCYLGRVDLEAPVGECFNSCSSLCLYA